MPQTIVSTLIDSLARRGVGHVFGIPGDYALGLFDALERSPLALINTCDEQAAGFAADAYARIRGLGAVAVTYGVGGLKLVNSTAQAYAERSPVVVISGAPGTAEMAGDALLHHRVRDFGTQMRVFREVTVAQALLDDASTAAAEIERVVEAALRSRRPVYLELPRDCAALPVTGTPAAARAAAAPAPDPATLAEAVDEAVRMLNAAENPIVLAGVEIHRFGLQDQLIRFIGKSGIRFATTIMGKSVVNEELPGFVGVYAGSLSNELARSTVEASDCVLNLGAMLTDLDTGIFTADLDPARMILASADTLTISRHHYKGIDLRTFLEALCAASLPPRPPLPPSCHAAPPRFAPAPDYPLSVARLFECLDASLSENIAVVADPGDALFGAIDLTIHSRSEFIACAYYASLGFAVPAAIALELAEPQWRPLVLVGDGAFQMTGMEVTTAVRYGLSPIVVVLDNAGFGTERPMLDGHFNDVQPWAVSEIPRVLGHGRAFHVRTEAEFADALAAALTLTAELVLIHVELARDDISPALQRLTSQLGKRV
ncbi:MAG: alpha-keto acid decarboxylase family protein [Gammaproteobacteria bacterium]|nr:alpha-keto acid decarboxylase family protein [Gammaproteobacteria bacterium]MCP5199856.1 alpha-keto acid decarboxylase family protein [Gammaproteobacteria bacterium]